MNTYRRMADITFWFHWIWVAIMIGGFFFQLTFPWYRPYHLAAITTTIGSQILWGGRCPLVALENSFRAKYDPKITNEGSFICHYLEKQFGIQVSPSTITAQLVVMTLLSVFLWIA